MSDKVKLVVTLTRGQYKRLNDIQYGSIGSRMILNAVKEATPLKDVKQKIRAIDFDFGDYCNHTLEIREMVFGVLDNIGEEKE